MIIDVISLLHVSLLFLIYNPIVVYLSQWLIGKLEINNINQMFNSKREFIRWKKKNKDIKIISLNKRIQCKFYDYIKKYNIKIKV